MGTEPTIHSLYDFVRDMREEHGKIFEEIKGKQDVTNVKLNNFDEWKKQHESDDKKIHQRLNDRLSKQANLAGIFGSIGTVGGFILAFSKVGDAIKSWWEM